MFEITVRYFGFSDADLLKTKPLWPRCEFSQRVFPYPVLAMIQSMWLKWTVKKTVQTLIWINSFGMLI